ncbi:hypothetical protein [Fodinibius salsisoli]|uniref:Uncharacterized protein n=1 Tax=Fodinibius salsisoli TaxID=2820877 RepID=A0ABT3PP82_9BACT|nr:hypothetical protein [Fodinibius salsisoli]MCW9707669.1 hypothetical protein [Fodinibius salsisoli]
MEYISIFISVVAVFFTYRGLSKMKEHNRKSVKPLLQHRKSIHNLDNGFDVKIYNKGLGPAIITEFYVKINDEKIDGKNSIEIQNKIKKELEENIKGLDIDKSVKLEYSALSDNSALEIGESFCLIRIMDIDLDVLAKVIENISIYCTYESFYNEEQEITIDLNTISEAIRDAH